LDINREILDVEIVKVVGGKWKQKSNQSPVLVFTKLYQV